MRGDWPVKYGTDGEIGSAKGDLSWNFGLNAGLRVHRAGNWSPFTAKRYTYPKKQPIEYVNVNGYVYEKAVYSR